MSLWRPSLSISVFSSILSNDEEKAMNLVEFLSWKPQLIPSAIAETINEMLHNKRMCACSFPDLQAAKVPFNSPFKLTENNPIYHNPRQISPRAS